MQQRVRMALILAVMAICLLVAGGVAAAQGFSADVVSKYGKETMNGKIYITKDKMRFETAGMVTITRMDKKVVWLLMPGEKMYMEQSIRLDNVVPSAEPSKDELERVLLGTETVNGYTANKYRVTVKVERDKNSFLMWLKTDNSLPVKMAAEDGKWSQEYRNIVEGEPDAALFEVPDNYKKFAMSMSMY